MARPKTISKKDLDKLGRIPLIKPSDSEEAMREMDKQKRAREKKKAAAKLKEDAEANLTAREDAEKDEIRVNPKLDKRTRTGKLGWITRKYKKLKEERRLGKAAKKKNAERIDSDGDDDSELDLHSNLLPVKKKLAAKRPASNTVAQDAVRFEPVLQDAMGAAGAHVVVKPAANERPTKPQRAINKAAMKDKPSKMATSPPAMLVRRSSSKITKRSAPELHNIGDHANLLTDLILAIQNDDVVAYGPVAELLLRALGMLNKMEDEIEQEVQGEMANIPASKTEAAVIVDAAKDIGERLDDEANVAAVDGDGDAVGKGDDADSDDSLRQFVMDQSD